MQEKGLESNCVSPIAVPERIMQEEEGFTTPKLAPKIMYKERQIEAFEQAPKKNLEKQEGQFDDPKPTLKKTRENKEGQVNDSKLTLKKAREKKERQFDDPKLTKKKLHQKEKQLEVLEQTPEKIRKVKKSPSQLFKGLERSQPEKQILYDPKAINETYLHCDQRSMKQLRMMTKIMIRTYSERYEKEQFLLNLPVGEIIKSEEVQLYDPQKSQQSQDIILTEEQEKEFQEIQASYQAMKKSLPSKNQSPQEILYNLPKLRKQYNVNFTNMKAITRIAVTGLIYNQAYKCQIQKGLTQTDKKTYEKQLFELDKLFQEIHQKIEYYFPGERDSIYKNLLPQKLYLICRKSMQQKMSFKQKPASVHILKIQ